MTGRCRRTGRSTACSARCRTAGRSTGLGIDPPVAGGAAGGHVRVAAGGGAGRGGADRLHPAGRPGAAGRRGSRPGRADRHDRCRHQGGARRGAAAHDQGGGRQRAAGPRPHPGAGPAGLARGPEDGAFRAALRAAAGHRRAAGACRRQAGDRPGHDRDRPRQRVRLGRVPVRLPAPGHLDPARPPGQRSRERPHRAVLRVGGLAVLPVRVRLCRAQPGPPRPACRGPAAVVHGRAPGTAR